jgi:hypothetical protein
MPTVPSQRDRRLTFGRICGTWAVVDDVGFYEQITGRIGNKLCRGRLETAA